jgi:hypothetical protein
MVIQAAGKLPDRVQIGIALEQVLQGLKDRVAVNEIRGRRAQARHAKLFQYGIIKGNIGLPGVEQHPVAIEGYQFQQIINPGNAAS